MDRIFVDTSYVIALINRRDTHHDEDCLSFGVMRATGTTQALTADHHFEQAGFRALLRKTSP